MTDGGHAEPLARGAYEELAESYAALAPTKPHNAFYERPATLSLLGEVGGRRVLDAGCGPGVYAEVLVERGAEVVGFDASEKMVGLAAERLGGRAEIFRALLEGRWDGTSPRRLRPIAGSTTAGRGRPADPFRPDRPPFGLWITGPFAGRVHFSRDARKERSQTLNAPVGGAIPRPGTELGEGLTLLFDASGAAWDAVLSS